MITTYGENSDLYRAMGYVTVDDRATDLTRSSSPSNQAKTHNRISPPGKPQSLTSRRDERHHGGFLFGNKNCPLRMSCQPIQKLPR